MPSIAQFATPVGLVLFTYAFALMISASSPSEAETQPAFTVVPATAVDPTRPARGCWRRRSKWLVPS